MTAVRFEHADLMHGRDYSGQECRGWVAQRKWDGVFALWDGAMLWTKTGHPIAVPDFFTADLPDMPLCCELVAETEGAAHATALLNRRAQSVAERAALDEAWSKALLHVFDAPQAGGGPLERVLVAADALAHCDNGFAFIVQTFEIAGRADLRTQILAALAIGWEGLMIQPAGHAYAAGRTSRLLKVKRQSLHCLRSA